MRRSSALRIIGHLQADGTTVAQEPACRPPVIATSDYICRITAAEIIVGPGLFPDQCIVIPVMLPFQRQPSAVSTGVRLAEDIVHEQRVAGIDIVVLKLAIWGILVRIALPVRESCHHI